MSRRHKEKETENNYKPQTEKSHEDGLFKSLQFTIIRDKLSSLTKLLDSSKFAEAVSRAVNIAISEKTIEIDDSWVKIPRSYFDSCFTPDFSDEVVDKMTNNRGRPFIKRLFSRITDNKVVDYFKDTLRAVKVKCAELFQNIAQYAVCFLKGLSQVFASDDDTYGKISHYHRILEYKVKDLPSRKTLSNCYKWFVEWKSAVTYESPKAKRERLKHRIWERLIEWIAKYLKKIAPEYAFA